MLKQLLIIFCIIGTSFAQIQQGGYPNYYDSRIDDINFIQIDKNNVVDRNFNPMVFQFGNEYDVNINVLENASIIQNGNNVTYLLGLESRDAYGIGINFNDFNLTENTEMFLYDEEQTMFLGSFNFLNNKPNGDLTTSIIKSDRVIIEINIPQQEISDLRLNIDTIIHDYTDIKNYFNTIDSDREDCNVNVVCSEGDDWRDQIDGVIRVQMGGGLCSGSIVNNTANDRTPYVLFADHCVSGSASGYVFDFNYQSTTCNGTSGPLNQSVSGSTVLASADINSGPDFALLEMTSDIPDSYNPFYVGWSKVSSAPQAAIGIHHPGGNIKKITQESSNVNDNGYFWEFQYYDGRVIPGSSGSPFFDENKRQVGIASYIYTNYCDPSPDCYCDQQYTHGYGRFDLAWNLGLSTYLDPLNSGAEAIDVISISGISIIHDAYEDIPFDQSSINFNADVTTYAGEIVIVELYYNTGDGFVSQDMTPQGLGGIYETTIDGLYDGMIVEYYIQAVNSEGVVQTYPSNAPDNTIVFVVGDLADLYFNDFEADSEGWIVGYPSDLATAGIWEIAEPVATYNDEGNQIQPDSDYSEQGTYCFITGNGYEDGNGGFDDVDNGATTLLSPEFNLSDLDEVVLTYYRWYTNNVGDNGGNDKWVVSVSNNGGITWEDLENSSSSSISWEKKRFILSNYIDFTDEMKFKFVAEDISYEGDAGSGGSLVEAALDDFLIEYISDGSGILGDINNDEMIDVLDVVLLVNMILGSESPNYATADINNDNQINVQDIISLINIILSE